MHSIELKFSSCIIGYCPTYCMDFGEFRINCCFTGAQKEFLHITARKSSHQNCANIQTVLSIKLKFDMYIVDPRSSYYINFGVSRRYSFLQDTKNVIHYGL